ncbi:MAG: hypothetical protein ACP5I8_08490 [Phycisphaerae bacterium]
MIFQRLFSAMLCGAVIIVPFQKLLAAPDSGKPPVTTPTAGVFPNKKVAAIWKHYSFNKTIWWGAFPHNMQIPANEFKTYAWAVGPFTKYAGNPVLSPTPGAWDQGHFSGGVHNGAIIVRGGKFYYIYRGERPHVFKKGPMNYICNIGVAISKDGMHFKKDTAVSPIFKKGYRRYSYEDPDVCEYKGTYYLFCNRFNYRTNQENYKINGTFLATSKDLLHWKQIGILFPHVARVHRNAVVLQGPHNHAIRVNGKFVMYLDYGLVAYSTDLVHWVTRKQPAIYPGGEVCFALGNYSRRHKNRIVLFTGGDFTGYCYAIGEVLFSKRNPAKPLAYLPAPVLTASPNIPYENGFSATNPHKLISYFNDITFFTGLTRHNGKWWMYYGGSEYYTCLATALANAGGH